MWRGAFKDVVVMAREKLRVHFSIDDVIMTLRWAYRNEPASIFNMKFFSALREWNKKYGLKATLYMFFSDGTSFDITMLQEKYVSELKKEKDWLKIAYHGIYGERYVENADRFKSEMWKFDNVWRDMGSQTVRLHGWQSPVSAKELKDCFGVERLLCPYEMRERIYDLTEDEINMVLKRKLIRKNGVTYRKTDISFDFCKNVNELAKQIIMDKEVVAFVHEWRFEEQKNIIEEFIQGVNEFEY